MPTTVTSPNMNIVVPVPLQELGPQWATDIQTALFTTIDQHNHTAGKGVQVPTAGLNINADLPFGGFNATALRAARFASQGAPLSLGADIGELYNVNGDAYWNNGAGTQIQLTASGLVNATFSTYKLHTPNLTGTTTILASDASQLFFVDVSGGVATINLPAASTLAPGRIYIFEDIKQQAGAHNISIVPNGTDKINGVNSTLVVNVNGAYVTMFCDGSANFYSTTTATVVGASLLAPVQETVRTVTTTPYTIDSISADGLIYVNIASASTITLPAPTVGRLITIVDISGALETNNITLARHGTETINGVAGSRLLRMNYGRWTIESDGTNWTVKGCGKVVKQVFTANGTFVAGDPGLYLVFGFGGGGGGGQGGSSNTLTAASGGGGGAGSIAGTIPVLLTAGQSVTVTLGLGGAGGSSGAAGAAGANGNDGSNTTFGNLATFWAGGGGSGGTITAAGADKTVAGGGVPTTNQVANAAWNSVQLTAAPANGTSTIGAVLSPACGGYAVSGDSASGGQSNTAAAGSTGGVGGAGGAVSGGKSGGGGGGGGPFGAGGAGSQAGVAGSNAGNNTGAGGGGGSCPASNAVAGGAGGQGGSGYCEVIWVD